jgi:AraC-like DNA-binding protein
MLNELKTLISAAADAAPGAAPFFATPIAGLTVMRAYEPGPPLRMIYRPVLCLVAQGAKQVMAGETIHAFGAGQALIVGVAIPATGQIVRASAAEPYLAAAVELDVPLLRELATTVAPPRHDDAAHAVFVGEGDSALTECMLRLLRLIAEPDAAPVLQPLLLRELHFRLLTGPYGAALARLAVPNGRTERIARAIRLLSQDFAQALRIEDLAAVAGMSVSTFHLHFKTATAMTPLQYQKQLRLLEARRLLLADASAARAAYAVGYESPTQFSREYARMFGLPPRRDAAQWRASA